MMTNKPVEVAATPHFARILKRLRKKYPHINEDVKPLIEQLQNGETPGDQIQGVGVPFFEVRAPNRDAQTGKRGGYRIIYYLKTKTSILLIDIYTKSERQDISAVELKALIDEVSSENEPPSSS